MSNPHSPPSGRRPARRSRPRPLQAQRRRARPMPLLWTSGMCSEALQSGWLQSRWLQSCWLQSRWLWARLPQLAVKSATASPTRAVPRAFHQSGAERAWLTRRPPRRAPASRSAPAVASRRHDRCCRLLPAAAAAAYAESLAAALARPLARRAAAPASAPRRPRAGGADAARPALRMPQRARGALLSPRLAPSTAAARAAAVHAAGQHPPRDARCRLNRAAATAAN
mmetsp:Transcript_35775/g.105749  ORF Transcript_35775/g.105749 Transcript_35775/m.105749 type:complete len:226 (+) Transcript_35775:165-842(+)